MDSKKCDRHSDDISDIKGDIKSILAILKSNEFVKVDKLHIELEKIHNRINKSIIGLSGLAMILGGALTWALKDGI